MCPAFHRDNGQFASKSIFQPSFSVDHLSQFADSTSVEYWYGMHPHETFLTGFAHRSVDKVARVRTVGHDERFLVLCTSFHHIMHGADIGVETCTDILNVEQDQVDVFQLGRSRLLVLSVEGEDGFTTLGVSPVFDGFSGISIPTKTMLGGKDFSDIDLQTQKGVKQVGLGLSYDGGMIDHQCNTFPI